MKTYAQRLEDERKNRQRILEVCPTANDKSGIYFFYREQDGIKYGYVGQAKHLLTRLAQHLDGLQHIDLSIKKHGLFGEKPNGYKIAISWCKECDLNRLEREAIRIYANRGYQLRNHTVGGQDNGKAGLGDGKSTKGYFDGVKHGYNKARKEVAHLFDLHLKAEYKANKPTKNAIKAMEKFEAFLQEEEQ